jgi:hypothetical protein
LRSWRVSSRFLHLLSLANLHKWSLTIAPPLSFSRNLPDLPELTSIALL